MNTTFDATLAHIFPTRHAAEADLVRFGNPEGFRVFETSDHTGKDGFALARPRDKGGYEFITYRRSEPAVSKYADLDEALGALTMADMISSPRVEAVMRAYARMQRS